MKVNQEALVLNHIMRCGSITAEEARAKYKIKSLSSRVCQLRRMGVALQTTKKGYTFPYWMKRQVNNETDNQQALFDYERD